MNLKGNFYQALRELFSHGGLVGSDLEEKAKSGSDLDSLLETTKGTMEDGVKDGVNPSNPKIADAEETVKESRYFKGFGSLMSGQKYSAQPQSLNTDYDPDHLSNDGSAEEITFISKNSIIEGNLRSFANVNIDGSIRGMVDVIKNVNIKGMLVGNLTCNNVNMQGSSIQGNVFAKGDLFIDHDSTLLGDTVAQYASIDGRVKGNVEIGSKIELGANAVVLGNVKTGSICVTDGANIQGYVNTIFLTEHGDTVFPNEVLIDDMHD